MEIDDGTANNEFEAGKTIVESLIREHATGVGAAIGDIAWFSPTGSHFVTHIARVVLNSKQVNFEFPYEDLCDLPAARRDEHEALSKKIRKQVRAATSAPTIGF